VNPIWRELCIWYYERALRNLHPLHSDVSWLVLEISRLKDLRMKGQK